MVAVAQHNTAQLFTDLSLPCRLHFIQKFTQPTAYAADLAAQYAGELLYYLLQAAWAVYSQLAAMKVLPQITSGEPAIKLRALELRAAMTLLWLPGWFICALLATVILSRVSALVVLLSQLCQLLELQRHIVEWDSMLHAQPASCALLQ